MAGMVRLTPALRRLLPDFFFNLVGCVRRKDEQREAAQHVSAIAAPAEQGSQYRSIQP